MNNGSNAGGGLPIIAHPPDEQRLEAFGARPLKNAEAKPIARKLFLELAKEFDADGVWKIIRNLEQFHQRTTHRLRQRSEDRDQRSGQD